MTGPDPVPDPWEDGKGFELRHVRAVLGVIAALAVIALLAYKIVAGRPWVREDFLLLIALLLFAAVNLLPVATLREVAAMLLPWKRGP